MKGISELISLREKRLLGLCVLGFFLSLIFFQVVALGKKQEFIRKMENLETRKKELTGLEKNQKERKEEWLQWKKAEEDVQSLRRFFYGDKKGFGKLREDLGRLFQESGINVEQLRYDYSEIDEGAAKKVKISFQIKGSYYNLKRFIHTVEKFPKFLLIENIRFLEIESQSGRLGLGFELSAYYEK